jgi:polygalacturonase
MSLTKVSYSMIQGSPYSILDYGAIPDGATDCSAAFQAAINAAGANTNGGVVIVPQGTYYLNATVRFANNVTIMGYGATILLGPWLAAAGGQAGAFVSYSGSTITTPSTPTATKNVSIYGLTINGQNSGISGQSIPDANMQGAIFVFGAWGTTDSPSNPLYWSNIQFTGYLVQDCYLLNFAGDGIRSYNGSKATIINNRFETFFSDVALATGAPIELSGTQNVIVSNNRTDHLSTGLSWHGMVFVDWNQIVRDLVVDANIISNLNNGDGISCEANGSTNLDGGIINANIVENCMGNGVMAKNAVDVIISNNIFRAGSSNNGVGILINGAQSAIIDANSIEGAYCSGIWTNGVTLRALIVSNRIQGTVYSNTNYQGDGIFVYNSSPTTATQIEISNNYIKDVAGCGVYSADPSTIIGNFIYNIATSNSSVRNFGIQASNAIVSNNTVIGLSAYGSFGIYVGDGITAQFNNVSGTYINGNYSAGQRKGYGGTQYYNYSRLNCDGVTNNITISASAIPSSYYWAVGDVVNNTSPTAGGNIGWVCTSAGTSGTWKSFGSISS